MSSSTKLDQELPGEAQLFDQELPGEAQLFDQELPGEDQLFDLKRLFDEDQPFDLEQLFTEEPQEERDASAVIKMLPKARMEKSTEVDRYFGEKDESNYFNYYNELLALHQLMETLTENRDKFEVLGMIEDLATKTRKTRKITIPDPTHKTIKENSFIDWIKDNGGKSNVAVASFDNMGRGAVATKNLEVGEIAFEVPICLIIYFKDSICKSSEIYRIVETRGKFSNRTCFALWILKDKAKSSSTNEKFYDTFPKVPRTGLGLGVEALAAYETLVDSDDISRDLKMLQEQYNSLFPALSNEYPALFPQEIFTWENFKWIMELLSVNGCLLKEKNEHLIPILTFLNFSPNPHIIKMVLDKTTQSVKFPVAKPCQAGEQIYYSYGYEPGDCSSQSLLHHFGFVLEETNPYDFLKFDIANHKGLIRDTSLSQNHGLFHYGLPNGLLKHLRTYINSSYGECTMLKKLETEIQVLDFLAKELERLKQDRSGLEDYNDEQRKTCPWDLQLVLKFYDNFKGMVNSCIKACEAGKEKVEGEILFLELLLDSPTAAG